jgi:hypothetical protein
MTLTRLIAATAAVAGLALTVPAVAGASSTEDATTTLNSLCVQRGGTIFWTPYTIARCQNARSNKGFEAERSVCELATGEFRVADGTTHGNRANWACISTTPPA